MVSRAFEYKAPDSVADAVALLAGSPGARVLAGGQDLLNRLRSRRVETPLVVDLRNIAGLRDIVRVGSPSDVIRVGAMATVAEIASNTDIGKNAVALREAAASVGDAATRNWSTLGGSLSSPEPANDLLAALLALEAVVHVQGKSGSRATPIAEFLSANPSRAGSELVTAVDIPVSPLGVGSAYFKFANVANLYPICGVAVAISKNSEGKVDQARVAVTGAGAVSSRRMDLEASLVSQGLPGGTLPEVIGAEECVSDMFASHEYRSHLAHVLATDAFKSAFERSGARGG